MSCGLPRSNAVCSRRTVDVGPVLADTTTSLRHAFVVKNSTRVPVKIIDIKASCTCTTSRLGKRSLGPGESTELELSASVPNSYSRADLFCTLLTNHPTAREWTYSMHFESLPRLWISPQHLNLGSFRAGDLKEGGVLAKAAGPSKLQVDLFGSNPEIASQAALVEREDGLTAQLTGSPEARPMGIGIWHRRFALDVALNEGFEVGAGNRAKSLVVNSGGAQASATLTWQVSQPIVASPSTIHFGAVGLGGKPAGRRLLLQSSEGKTFRVTSADGGEHIRFAEPSSSEAIDGHLLVDFEFAPPESGRAGTASGVIQLATDDVHQPVVRVPWTAIVGRSVRSGAKADR